MGMLDTFADRQFAKEQSGRLVFLPRGPRRPAYFVDSADENKLKSLVKVYGVAAALINLTGTIASLAFTQALTFDQRSAPLAYKLRFGLVVYAISATLLYIGPALLLWNVYRGVVDGLCSSLTTVDPESLRLTRLHSSSRRSWLILLFAGLLILGLGIFFATNRPR
ncbi:MAG TPA: hypothetical protein VMD99_11580 [Terriglobales bacterium]|nr:hypothetical protein [Terriglobales bacterium]